MHYNEFEMFRKFETDIDTEFKINEEKRTITCIITTRNDFLNKLIKYGFADAFNLFALDWDGEDIEEKKYVGVAKCAPGDTWDEMYGCDLAEARAMNKRRADLNGRIEQFVRRMYGNLDNLLEFGRLKRQRYPEDR